MRKWPTVSTLASATLLVLFSLTLGTPVRAAVTGSISQIDIVKPGLTNNVALTVMMEGLPTIFGASVTLTGVTSNPTIGGWTGITSDPNSFTTCAGTGFSISTGVSTTGSCLNMTGPVISWDAGSTKSVGTFFAFRFPAGSLTFAASGPYTLAIKYSSTTVATYTLSERTTSTVTFDSNGGSGTMATQSAGSTEALTANAFIRPGFRFTGWSTSSGTASVVYANSSSYPFNPASSNQTLYAQWTALTPQSPALTVSSTTGTFGSPLTLATAGGAGTGLISYSVSNGTASGCSISAGALSVSSAGTCTVTATKNGDATYDVASSVGTPVTMNKATRTLSFGATTSYTLAYGATQTVTATPSAGAGNGTVSYSLSSGTACTVNSVSGQISVVASSGSCVISAAITEGTNYLAATTSTQATVNSALRIITIRGGSPSVNYGTTVTPTAVITGGTLVGAQSIDNATTTFSYSGINGTLYGPSNILPQNAGTYSVLPLSLGITGGSASNYNISYSAGTLSISAVSRTLSFGATTNYSLAYGATQIVTATPSNGDGSVSYSSGSSTACSVDPSSGLVSVTAGSGSCAISATITGGTNHLDASTTTSVTVAVSPRLLTLTAGTTSITVGGTVISSYSLTTGTLIGNDDISGATYTFSGTGATTFASSTTAPSAIGTYLVTPSIAAFSTGSATNYTISYATGTLTIASKTTRSISFVVNAYNLTFGETQLVVATPSLAPSDGSLTYSSGSSTACNVNSSGLVSMTAPSGTCTISATISEGVFNLSASTSTPVTVTPQARPISITAANLTLAYGAAVTPSHTLSSGTMAGSDVISGVTYTYAGSGSTSYSVSTTAPIAAGTYTVTPSAAQYTVGSAAHYSVTYVAGLLIINAAAIAPTTVPAALVGQGATPTTTTGAAAAGSVNSISTTLVKAGSTLSIYVQISGLLLLIGVALTGTRHTSQRRSSRQ